MTKIKDKAAGIKYKIKENKESGLWTKNFTLITVGTVVSMLGNAIAGFAMGLLILDYTKSTFLYALYMVMYNAPKIIAPTLAGPFIDKFSRRCTIYMLDFISAGVYGFFAWLMLSGNFNYTFLIIGCLILGMIDSIYQVTYDSFYPMLVEEANYSKAYSVHSMIENITMVMVPVSAFLYNSIGIAPLFICNMLSFFLAAVLETQIKQTEDYVKKDDEEFGLKQYISHFKEGISYLKEEKALAAITLYFTVYFFVNGSCTSILMPYFKHTFENGEYIFMLTFGWIIVGRVLGGVLHYRMKIPSHYKYKLSLIIYIAIDIIDGAVLYFPVVMIAVLYFIEGILSISSYNIRVSATQSYVPDEKKGRFNSLFQTLTTAGGMLGQLSSGACTLIMPERTVISIYMAGGIIAAILIIGGNKKIIKALYNR